VAFSPNHTLRLYRHESVVSTSLHATARLKRI